MTQAKLIVETGTFKGFSTARIVESIPFDVKLITIDHKDNRAGTIKTPEYASMYEFMELDSRDALDILSERYPGEIGILWIDSDHRTGHVLQEVDAAKPGMSANGIIIMHDIFHPAMIGVVEGMNSRGWNSVSLMTPPDPGRKVPVNGIALFSRSNQTACHSQAS